MYITLLSAFGVWSHKRAI